MERLWQLPFSPDCLLCGQRSHSRRELCSDCMRELSWNRHCCGICAAPLPEQSPIRSCGACLKDPPAWDGACSPLLYAWPLNQLLQRFKFNSDLATGKLLGELLAEYLAAGCSTRPDLLLPVPLHSARLRQRGFNQARELARPVARRLRLSIAHPGVCVRIKDTAVQSELDAVARRRNLRSAFRVNRCLAGAHVAILDDVLTTGATASALSTALREAGAARVQVWC
ncbi:MAG: ComF family protein, partial [Gammaproteobacteria bacterium]|nr:ComF family protein [Gammaproteobacteria bacterium]